MKVLFLGPTSPTLKYLETSDEVFPTEEPITASQAAEFDFLVSHGYRHILRRDVLDAAPAVNLHISMLPWNRGADPNVWSWIDNTPKGVTIHWIDGGIDTGPVIAQREVEFPTTGIVTLASTYAMLQAEMTRLFVEWWPRIRRGAAPGVPQTGGGSYHRVRDLDAVRGRLLAGWETRVVALRRQP